MPALPAADIPFKLYTNNMLVPILKVTLRPVIPSSASYVASTEEPIGSPMFWWKLAISMCLVLGGGVFAGVSVHKIYCPRSESAYNGSFSQNGRSSHWA